MSTGSFLHNVQYAEERPQISVILETPFSKEIRIAMTKGQLMKDHSAPLPIVVQVLKGQIDFGYEGTQTMLMEGDIIALDSSVRHNLLAVDQSIVRLSLSKKDKISRVEEAAKK